MRLVPKLALALLAGVFAVIAAFTAYRVRGEIDLYDHEVRRDHRIIGTTAAAALARSRTREDAKRLGERVDASRDNMRIRFVSLGPTPAPGTKPLASFAGHPLPAPGVLTQRVELVHSHVGALPEGEYLLTYVGAPVVDEPHGAIELAESLAPRAAYISRGLWSALGTSVAMLLVCGVIMASIGAKMVGQPVSELIGAAGRIGAGQFDVLGTVHRRDEFGELARALRTMGLELEAAQKRMRDEADARVQALEQLRHAERLATLGQLASVLAHEIGTPLNVIAGHAKLVANRKLGEDGVVESAVAIGAQCERMTQIVRRILDYARRRAPRRALIDAADVMSQARELLGGLSRQRGVQLELEVEQHAEISADQGQLQQALTNLIMNAVQASAHGQQVKLRVRQAKAAPSGPTTEFVVLEVEDSGNGIPKALRERIFEPFFTTKPAGDGTGLGLSVVGDIVKEHGGFVEVRSHEGAGSRFSIYLPKDSGDASPRIDR